ncbi:MAG: citrate synthase [Nitrososphaeria archaeon]|nr:citrate synthase [Conexivisphaerales archaeon]
MESISKGLEDVNIKWTRLTTIDGQKGILWYMGYKIEDIINSKATAEEIQYMFLYGQLPTKAQLEDFKKKVQEGYKIPEYAVKSIINLPRSADSVALQMNAMASFAATEKFTWNKQTNRDYATRIIGQMASVTSVVIRHVLGKEPKLLEPSDSLAKSFLKAVFDREPTEKEVEAMNDALILYLDHEVPASTTAGLVVVSTLADIYSGIVGALAALKGPLHGGAAEAAAMQFLEIGNPSKVDSWFVDNIKTGKKRLMGFGHRVYKTYDPRAKIFKKLAQELNPKGQAKTLFEIAEKLETLGINEFGSKGIYPNTDFYSGIVYMTLGFPLQNNIYTALFALSRVTGWMAHFLEYVEEQHRLIRPRAVYVGPSERQFIPIDKR